jgi:hypothetical protein
MASYDARSSAGGSYPSGEAIGGGGGSFGLGRTLPAGAPGTSSSAGTSVPPNLSAIAAAATLRCAADVSPCFRKARASPRKSRASSIEGSLEAWSSRRARFSNRFSVVPGTLSIIDSRVGAGYVSSRFQLKDGSGCNAIPGLSARRTGAWHPSTPGERSRPDSNLTRNGRAPNSPKFGAASGRSRFTRRIGYREGAGAIPPPGQELQGPGHGPWRWVVVPVWAWEHGDLNPDMRVSPRAPVIRH